MSKKGKGRLGQLRFRISYLEYRVLVALIGVLPLWIAQPFVAGCARIVFRVAKKRVGYMLVNLRLAFPDWSEEERRSLARESWVHFAWNALDMARCTGWDAAQVEAHVSVEGVEHLENALAAGCGVIALTLHMGNFELGVRRAPLLGLPISAVARPMRNHLIRDHLFAQRERNGAEIIPTRGAVTKVLRALKQGRIIPVLNDQYIRSEDGVFVPLFGKRCSTSHAVVALAFRSRAPMIACYVVRDRPDHHRMVILPALEFERTGDRERDIEAASAQCNAALEEIIRRHPEQWMWSHRRFRYSPDLPDDPYGDKKA